VTEITAFRFARPGGRAIDIGGASRLGPLDPTILPVPIAEAALVPPSLDYAQPHALTADYNRAPTEPAMPHGLPVHQLLDVIGGSPNRYINRTTALGKDRGLPKAKRPPGWENRKPLRSPPAGRGYAGSSPTKRTTFLPRNLLSSSF
jgi:hypothetical protein